MEAEQIAKKAKAFQLYQEAAQLDMLLEELPPVAQGISGPLTLANMITCPVKTGAVGVAKMPWKAPDILSCLLESVQRLTNITPYLPDELTT